LITLPETNDGIRSLHKGQWHLDFDYRGKPDQYGTFDGVLIGDHLWTAVNGYDQGTPITLLKRIGFREWHKFEFINGIPGQRPTIWALGTDGKNLFVGVAGFGRGSHEDTIMDGIWKIDLKNPRDKIREDAFIKAQVFCKYGASIIAGATGGGIYKRSSGHWRQMFGLGAKFVVSIVRLGDFTYYGTAYPGLVYRGKGLAQPALIKKCGTAARVGIYQNRVCMSWTNESRCFVDWI
jgi:hypothetical protein